jgi:hypothetical protein
MQPMLLIIVIVVIVVVIGLRFGMRRALYELPRRYRAFGGTLLMALALAANYFLPTRDPVRRRSEQIILLVILAAAGLVVAGTSLRRRRTGWKLAEWAPMHGFRVISECRSPAQATLPESLRQLPLLRSGQEPETFFVLERDDRVHDLQTMIFGFVVSRIQFSPWAMRQVDRPLTMTVFAFRRPTQHLPAFELRPANLVEEPTADELGETPVKLAGKPRFAERYTLRGRHSAEIGRVFSDALVNALERESGWCLEGFGEWCIAYHYRQARTFWTFRPSGFEYCADVDQLAARLETARHLFGLIGGQLSR